MKVDVSVLENYLMSKVMTQKDFAQMAGISRTTIVNVMARGTAARSTVSKMAAAMAIEPQELTRR